MSSNRITSVFKIKYPIIQGGMIWCSGWRLASAVSNAGGLGLLGSGSMDFDIFKDQLRKCKAATDKPFGVNLSLTKDLTPYIEHLIAEKVPVVFTSAGSPKLWTKELQKHGIVVAHVVPSIKLALKCQDAGVNVVVAEGFEAGGHNGLEEITTLTLIPQVRKSLSPGIPLVAAGGIASGDAMLAAFALGAEGVQVGTRFAVTQESSCAEAFKKACTEATESSTFLTLRNSMPTRMLANNYSNGVKEMCDKGASKADVVKFYGPGKTREGMLNGDVVNGELEIGQIVSTCKDIPTAATVVERLVKEFGACKDRLAPIQL